MKIFKKILNTMITILIVVILIVSILIAVMSLTSKASGISTIFGYTIQTIQSDSMKGGYKGSEGYTGGDFSKGDIIIGKATDFDPTKEYESGDIVTYKGLLQGAEDAGEQLICHRIIDVKDRNGVLTYQTKGDNESVSQVPDQSDENSYISANLIGSVFHTRTYDGTVIHGAGNFLDFIRSQLGFFLVVLLPMIIFFLYELIRVVLNFAGYKKAKEDENKVYEGSEESIDVSSPSNVSMPSGMSEKEYKEFQEFQAFKKMQEQMKNKQSDESVEIEKSDVNNENNINDT